MLLYCEDGFVTIYLESPPRKEVGDAMQDGEQKKKSSNTLGLELQGSVSGLLQHVLQLP